MASRKAAKSTPPCEGDAAVKRARLLTLSRGSYVSHRGLEGVIAQLKETGVPEFGSRTSQSRYRTRSARRQTPYGALVRDMEIPLTDDEGVITDFTISVQDPFAMLYVATAECDSFNALLRKALETRRPTPEDPWGLIVYADEIGHNPLLTNDPRKVQAIYYSFVELGIQALSTESAWFVLCTVRSNLVVQIEAGMSQLIRLLLRELFSTTSRDTTSRMQDSR